MFEFDFIGLFIIKINVIRYTIGILLFVTGLLGKVTSLDEPSNTSTLVFLTGILLMGLSIS